MFGSLHDIWHLIILTIVYIVYMNWITFKCLDVALAYAYTQARHHKIRSNIDIRLLWMVGKDKNMICNADRVTWNTDTCDTNNAPPWMTTLMLCIITITITITITTFYYRDMRCSIHIHNLLGNFNCTLRQHSVPLGNLIWLIRPPLFYRALYTNFEGWYFKPH